MGGEKYLKKKWGGTKIWLLYALKDTHMMTHMCGRFGSFCRKVKKNRPIVTTPQWGGKRDSRRVVRRCGTFGQECLYESRASGM